MSLRVGFDITALYVAQAGVLRYTHALPKALLEIDQGNEYLMLDYAPLHSQTASLPEIAALEKPNARVVHCQGLKHRRLARWDAVQQQPALRSLADRVDRTLFWPWATAARTVMRRKLTQVLDGADVFHSSDVLLWEQPGALNVVTIHDLTTLLFPEYHTANTREMQALVRRFAQEKANIVIAVSEATKRDILANLEIPDERVRVVHNGVGSAFHPTKDREALTRVLTPLGLDPGGYILHVGTIEPRKNLVRLVDAYHQARQAIPPPMPKLALVGGKGWQFHEVFKRVEELALRKEVVFLGMVPANILPALYSGAVLFTYPSLYEGFGLPPLEAMACGTPVIAANTSSLPEIVGDAGVLVNPTDTQALADALASLLNDAKRRADLSARGLARAKLFSWKQTAIETLKIYTLAEE